MTGIGDAIISPCQRFRYVLHRHIPCVLRWVRPALFVCLNPSTATASVDDPSVRRMIGFAKLWQCTSLTVVNLFAFRATDPADLYTAFDSIGPDNDHHIREQVAAHRLGVIVAAWGAHEFATKRARFVYPMLGDVKCLGTTKSGAPRHPLYVKADQPLIDWSPA